MNKIEITTERFLSFPPIKPGVVHRHKKLLYKYSPTSLNIIETIDKNKHEAVMKHLATPKALLFNKKQYLGYTMQYYQKLKKVQQAVEKGTIKELTKFMMELLEIIEKLNQLNLLYWDFHDKNILVDTSGHPFLIDVDGMIFMPTIEELLQQREYLTEFILNIYLNECKTTNNHLRNPAIRANFSKEAIFYLENLKIIATPAPDLPYCIVEELSDKEKVLKIKSSII